jgi:hypothetical protein
MADFLRSFSAEMVLKRGMKRNDIPAFAEGDGLLGDDFILV